MKNLVLLISSFMIMLNVLGQEQESERLNIEEVNKKVKSVEFQKDKPIKSSVENKSNSNYPIKYTVGVSGVQRVVKKAKTEADFRPETIEEVKIQLKEVYGDYYKIYGEPYVLSNTEFYKRCEFITLNSAPDDIPNISTLDLIDKYNYEKVHENRNIVSFDQSVFNIYKYRIDRSSNNDLYFRIYSTDMVLKIRGLGE